MLKQKVDYQVKLTVEELISFGRYPYSQGRLSTEDYQKIDQAITYMNLDSLRKRRIDQLSGGQLQRVNIAMILAKIRILFYWMNLSIIWTSTGDSYDENFEKFGGRFGENGCRCYPRH